MNILIFDLNHRLGASSAIFTDLSFNLPYNSCKLLLNESIKIKKTKKLPKKFFRYYSHKWN